MCCARPARVLRTLLQPGTGHALVRALIFALGPCVMAGVLDAVVDVCEEKEGAATADTTGALSSMASSPESEFSGVSGNSTRLAPEPHLVAMMAIHLSVYQIL